MRRPLLIVFIFLLFISFIYTNNRPLDNIKDKERITIEGVVKDKIEKDKYDQYKVEKYLVNDYSRKLDIKIGKIVKINGKEIKKLSDRYLCFETEEKLKEYIKDKPSYLFRPKAVYRLDNTILELE